MTYGSRYSLRLQPFVQPDIIAAKTWSADAPAGGRCMMIFLEVAIGAMAAALLAVPVLMAVTGRKSDASERQSG